MLDRKPRGVLLDTSFFIRLLNESDRLYFNAKQYYEYFLSNKIQMFISTISIAEFCVLGDLTQLPIKNLHILPFNINHAKKAGEVARYLYEARKNKSLDEIERKLIINDAKLFAQASTESSIDYFVTSDTKSINLFNILKNMNLNFDILDIHKKLSVFLGKLDFE